MSPAELDAVPLDALIAAIRRRCLATATRAMIRCGALRVDIGGRQAVWRGRLVPLSRREVDVLVALAAAHPRGLTAHELTELLWGEVGEPANARVQVRQLRLKLPDLIPELARHGQRAPYHLDAA